MLLGGDGIGPEVIAAAQEVLEATGLPFAFSQMPVGWSCFEAQGVALPPETLQAVRDADAALLGAVGSPSRRVEGYRSPVVGLRRGLDLYACLRPVRTPPLPGALAGVDMVIVRENSEGLYSGRERRVGDEAVAERVITRRGSERIVRFALDYAREHARKRITVVHKANVLRETDGLFRETAFAVLEDASPIVVDELLVDTAAYHMVRHPQRFDVLVTTNLFGDILSDAASAWGGGLGLAVSANLGVGTAIFEPVHGSAPDIVGQGIANPLAAIGAAGLLLQHLGHHAEARQVQRAIDATLAAGVLTPDIGGDARTADVLRHVLHRLEVEQNTAGLRQ
ncbi:MAG: homoisocitrate dehydrogenase [Herpetosiphon sp.]